jgi:hypothetical protein
MTTIRAMLEMLPRLRHRVQRLLRPASNVIDTSAASPIPAGTLIFRCNVCSSTCSVPIAALEREGGHCAVCDSSMRFRSLIYCLSLRLFGASLPIAAFPADAKRLRGFGMSDTGRYAELLAAKLGYTNTYYHKAPRLDVQAPPPECMGVHDFAISSDVFEHVVPPIATAFTNLRLLLKPGGVLVFTVPLSLESETVEHFPELHEFEIRQREGGHVLVNRTIDGRTQEFTELVFHGGPGSTLEMRLFSEAGLRRELERAGFVDIRFHREPCFEVGIYWHAPWSVPITAIAG